LFRPSDTRSPTPDTLTECAGFRGFRRIAGPESHSGWRDGVLPPPPRPTQPRSRLGCHKAVVRRPAPPCKRLANTSRPFGMPDVVCVALTCGTHAAGVAVFATRGAHQATSVAAWAEAMNASCR
jgi:hypothetical protein